LSGSDGKDLCSSKMEDADTDRPDPERQHEELMASVNEMGSIDCPCGWTGDANKARIVGAGGALDLLCPECRRRLLILSIDE
jgi:hypothetical protein